MKKRIAIIGDIHGCISELTELLDRLATEQLDAIFHLGDLVDRGPDSGAVVSLVRQAGLLGIKGNHESALLRARQKPFQGLADDTKRSLTSVGRDPTNWEYLDELPRLHVLDDVMLEPVVLVHGGLWPGLPIWKQPIAVLYAQLINPEKPGDVAWFNDASAKARGLLPWYDLWDGEEWVVYGHSVFREPQEIGRTIGIDTGCVFGGRLTALILPDKRYISVPAREQYVFRDNLYRDPEPID